LGIYWHFEINDSSRSLSMETRTILITGGAGYIGYATTLELQRLGYRIVVFDNQKNDFPNPIIYEKGSITNLNNVEEVFSVYRPDIVFHFAALTSIPESQKKQRLYFSVNVDGGTNILHAMRKYSCNKMIFSSSSAVYKQTNNTIDENNLIEPKSIYGKTKKIFEEELQKEASKNKLRYIILRYFNVSGRYDKTEGSSASLMNTITKVYNNQLESLHVFGNTFPTRDGTAIRDYVHIQDVVSANICSLNLLNKSSNCYTFNIGSGTASSVLEVIQTFAKKTGKTIPVMFDQPHKASIYCSIANINKAKKVLKWSPTHSILSEIIASYV
jgi:UDP-glucose 4-epimerase